MKNMNNENAKKMVSINLNENVIEYFKNMALTTGIGYQNLINMYLIQCVKENKHIQFI